MKLSEAIDKLKGVVEKFETTNKAPEAPEANDENKDIQETPAEEKHEFETAKLNDGVTIVEWEGELMTGTIVFVVSEEGKLPLPEGQYVLEDGTTFNIVDENGAADNVVKGEAPAEEAPAATPADEEVDQEQMNPKRVIESVTKEQVFEIVEAEVKKVTEAFETKLAEVNEKFETATKENETLKEDFEKVTKENKELVEVAKAVLDAPVENGLETSKKEKFSVEKQRKTFRESLEELEAQRTKENLS